MSAASSVAAGIAVLALAALLATTARMGRPGSGRRNAEEAALILTYAGPAVALFARYLSADLWAPAGVVAVAYGGFYLTRMRQLRRADRDALRRLLGLDRNASFGEVGQQLVRLEPRPLTPTTRIALVLAAAAVAVAGLTLGRFDTAMAALALGAAETSLRPAYRRALVRRAREIGR
ncbi:MAG TPA: hypothetical protein VMU66_09965 [Gaiellales bacterium]|nr:hypothetical protein [Gaiellales bacterium]